MIVPAHNGSEVRPLPFDVECARGRLRRRQAWRRLVVRLGAIALLAWWWFWR